MFLYLASGFAVFVGAFTPLRACGPALRAPQLQCPPRLRDGPSFVAAALNLIFASSNILLNFSLLKSEKNLEL